jgi:hypothetical protein
LPRCTTALCTILTGRGGLRERLRLALAELQQHRALCSPKRTDPYKAKVLRHLPGLLAEGAWLAALNEDELEDLAGAMWGAERTLSEALSQQAAVARGELRPGKAKG